MTRRAIIYYCPFRDLGVACHRAPYGWPAACGCKPRLRRGLSQSQRRRILKQVGVRVSPTRLPRWAW